MTFTSHSHYIRATLNTYHTNAPPLPTISSCLVSISFIACSLISSFDFSGLSFDLPIVLYHSCFCSGHDFNSRIRFWQQTNNNLSDSTNTTPLNGEWHWTWFLKTEAVHDLFIIRANWSFNWNWNHKSRDLDLPYEYEHSRISTIYSIYAIYLYSTCYFQLSYEDRGCINTTRSLWTDYLLRLRLRLLSSVLASPLIQTDNTQQSGPKHDARFTKCNGKRRSAIRDGESNCRVVVLFLPILIVYVFCFIFHFHFLNVLRLRRGRSVFQFLNSLCFCFSVQFKNNTFVLPFALVKIFLSWKLNGISLRLVSSFYFFLFCLLGQLLRGNVSKFEWTLERVSLMFDAIGCSATNYLLPLRRRLTN